jgi:hypothetical protein
MRFDYMTTGEERSLVPLFSRRTLSLTFTFLWLLAFLLVLLWPKKELFAYLREQEYPFAFLGTLVSALLMMSYLNLRWGGAEFSQNDYFSALTDERTLFLEEELPFFTYGMIGFIIHVGLQIGLCLPLLLSAPLISGVSFSNLAKAASILFTSALLCRTFGFLLYLYFGHNFSLKYYLSRAFFFLFFFASGFMVPFVNPLVMVYYLYSHEEVLFPFPMNAYLLHMMVVISLILFSSLAANLKIQLRSRAGKSG